MAPGSVASKESRPFALTISSRTPASRTNHSQSGYRHVRLPPITCVVFFVFARACQTQRPKQSQRLKLYREENLRDRQRDTGFLPLRRQFSTSAQFSWLPQSNAALARWC